MTYLCASGRAAAPVIHRSQMISPRRCRASLCWIGMTTPTETQRKLAQLQGDTMSLYDMHEEDRLRFDRIDAKLREHANKLDEHAAKLAEHDARFDAIDAKLAEHDARFDRLEAKVDEVLDLLRSRSGD